jgi:ribonuclease P protein component
VLIDRLQRSVDFQEVLATAPCARSGWFFAYHLARTPSRPGPRKIKAPTQFSTNLSTELPELVERTVENYVEIPLDKLWTGAVVPKRMARCSVTRQLVKRQIRAAMMRHGLALPSGLWVIKLRAPIRREQFRSAASELLRASVRAELDQLLGQAARKLASPAPVA